MKWSCALSRLKTLGCISGQLFSDGVSRNFTIVEMDSDDSTFAVGEKLVVLVSLAGDHDSIMTPCRIDRTTYCTLAISINPHSASRRIGYSTQHIVDNRAR